MTLAFTATQDHPMFLPATQPGRRVLVTGAAGRIGSYFAEHSHGRYDLTLMVRDSDDDEPIRAFGRIVKAELEDLGSLKAYCKGIDTVLHLAASPSPSSVWNEVLHNNLIGTYNVFVAAKAAGCRRVVYASSIHAVSGYPSDVQVKVTDPVNPGDLYGVSKCFGEAMCRYMAEQEGLSSIAIRIGAFQPRDAARKDDSFKMLNAFVSQRDLNQLIQRCIDAQGLQFAIVHGLSDNHFNYLDITYARELLGYRPQDSFIELNPKLRSLDLEEKVLAHNKSEQKQKSGLREELGTK